MAHQDLVSPTSLGIPFCCLVTDFSPRSIAILSFTPTMTFFTCFLTHELKWRNILPLLGVTSFSVTVVVPCACLVCRLQNELLFKLCFNTLISQSEHLGSSSYHAPHEKSAIQGIFETGLLWSLLWLQHESSPTELFFKEIQLVKALWWTQGMLEGALIPSGLAKPLGEWIPILDNWNIRPAVIALQIFCWRSTGGHFFSGVDFVWSF